MCFLNQYIFCFSELEKDLHIYRYGNIFQRRLNQKGEDLIAHFGV